MARSPLVLAAFAAPRDWINYRAQTKPSPRMERRVASGASLRPTKPTLRGDQQAASASIGRASSTATPKFALRWRSLPVAVLVCFVWRRGRAAPCDPCDPCGRPRPRPPEPGSKFALVTQRELGIWGTRPWGRHLAGLAPPFAVFCLAAALYYTLTSAYSSQFFARNITGFVCFGDTGLPARYLPPHALVDPNGPGYDGQFHFMVAQDLLGSGEVGQFVDNPAYRYQRILYPALAAVWARGDVALLPSALLKLNLLAVAATTALLAWMLRRRQLPPWYALIYPLFSSLVLATLRDLSEPTALFFLVLSLHFYLEARVVGTAAALALAILGRETALALVPVLVLDAMWHRRGTRAALVSAAALGPFALWSGYLYSQFGQLGLGVGERCSPHRWWRWCNTQPNCLRWGGPFRRIHCVTCSWPTGCRPSAPISCCWR